MSWTCSPPRSQQLVRFRPLELLLLADTSRWRLTAVQLLGEPR